MSYDLLQIKAFGSPISIYCGGVGVTTVFSYKLINRSNKLAGGVKLLLKPDRNEKTYKWFCGSKTLELFFIITNKLFNLIVTNWYVEKRFHFKYTIL